MFDLVDEAFHEVALLVDVLVVGDGLRSGPVGRNDGNHAVVPDRVAEGVGIVGLVAKQVLTRQAVDERARLDAVVHLAGGENEA